MGNRKGMAVMKVDGENHRSKPLVDLDGTLIVTDTLVESILRLIKQSPLNIFKILLWIFKGRSLLKSEVAMRSGVESTLLPYLSHPGRS